jgi:hypothetical protein
MKRCCERSAAPLRNSGPKRPLSNFQLLVALPETCRTRTLEGEPIMDLAQREAGCKET